MGVCPRTIRYHHQLRGLPVRMLSEKIRRISRADLAQWCRKEGFTGVAGLLDSPVLTPGLLAALVWRVGDARKVLGVGEASFREMERALHLPVRRVPGRGPEVDAVALAGWLASLPMLPARTASTYREAGV